MDFLKDLGSLAIATRLGRISEQFVQQVRTVYESTEIDLNPRYFSLVRYLATYRTGTVTEIANALGLTHPAVSQMVKALIEEGWIDHDACAEDDRKRNLTFSSKGKKLVAELEPIWSELKLGLDEILNETKVPFMDALAILETALKSKPLIERVSVNQKNKPSIEGLEIVEWDPRYAALFEDLNRSWIEKDFKLEKNDLQILRDPEKYILKPGGFIFFAKQGGAVVGTCALMRRDKHVLELARMAVADHARRRGIGRELARAAIRKARKEGINKLVLETFTPTLMAGIELYRSLGFKELTPPSGKYSYVERANVYMELIL